MDNRTLFNAQGGNFTFNFLPLGAIDGMRIGSTLSYLNQAQSQQGTPVMVLLSRNSRVDAYRNEQLLGSDSNLLIVFYVQIMPDDLVMQLHRF